MDKKNHKPKEGGLLDKEHGKGKGSEHGKTKDANKGLEKEKSVEGKEGSIQDCEPIVRKPALMRTPPMKGNLSVLNSKDGSGGITPTESTSKDDGKGAERERLSDGKEGSTQDREPIVAKSALKRTPQMKGNLSVLNPKDGPGGITPTESTVKKVASEENEDGTRSVRLDLFKRSGITRSPPRKLGRTGSFSEIERKITFGNVLEQSTGNDDKKRKRSDSDELGDKKNSKERKSAIQLMKRKLLELKDEVSNEVLKTSKMEELVEELCTLIETAEVEEMISFEEGKDGGLLRQRRIVTGKIKKTNSYRQFLELEQMNWPKECFVRTNINSGNFPTDKGDIIFLRNNEDPDMTIGVAKRLKENFPEIAQINEDTWETLITHSRRASQTGTGTGWEKRIHVGKDARGEELYAALTELKNLMIETNREKGVLPLDRGREDKVSLAKMLECIFKDTTINIEIYSQDFERDADGEGKNIKNNALLVKTSKENYAETLRRVKEQIVKSGKSMEFRKIRSTRDGNMLIELNEGDKGLDLEKVISGDGGGIETKILDKGRVNVQKFVIRDLDALITKDEIENILKENALDDKEKELVRLVSIRKAEGDTQTAIIEISAKQGERINGVGGIAMGLIKSTLKRWVEVVRCFRCWELGHRASECNGTDRTTACLRCGQMDGHNAKNCKNADYCPLCQREGHRAGSGMCPKMRLAIENLRKQQANRRRNARK